MINRVGSIRACSLRLPFKPETSFPTPAAIPFRRRLCRRFTSSCSATVSSNKKEKVIVISGPTGAGKSKLALELAKRLNGEIISADSVQVYRGLDVGSAKPSLSERKEVSHHLIDILHPSQDYSAGQFCDDGRQATKDILNRGRVPIVTGGTGFYLRWFMYGKPDVPKATPEVTAEVNSVLADLERNGDWDAAVRLVVKAGDPSSQSLAANDWYRLRRKLEIIKSTGSPPSAFAVPYKSFKEKQHDFHVTDSSREIKSSQETSQEDKQIDLDYDFKCFLLSSRRVDLYRSIDLRCEDMLSGSDGILSEASWLLKLGILPNSNSATKAIGYKQKIFCRESRLSGKSSESITRGRQLLFENRVITSASQERAMEYLVHCKSLGGASSVNDFYAFLSQFQKASRNFAKRQLTWFRNEEIYQWIDASRPLEEVINFICNAYHDQTGNVKVPESLRMQIDVANNKEYVELKAYRTKNRQFIRHEDCTEILNWISKTQRPADLII